jgi:hypothetical protein
MLIVNSTASENCYCNGIQAAALQRNRSTNGEGRAFLGGVCASLLAIVMMLPAPSLAATGDMAIEAKALGSTIRLETAARFAGAVSSLVFRGKQYVDIRDHGRELQSASSFDSLGECFNPTEAGGVADGDKQTSSSQLLGSRSGRNWLATSNDMAFWLPPGYDYKHQCGNTPAVTHAVNKDVRGGHILDKRIELGEGAPNVIGYHVTYHVPEAHTTATFEAATIYTPVDFSERYVLNLQSRAVEPTSIIGEQAFPAILATKDGKNAVGVFSKGLPQEGRGYGSFTFSNTQKLNCVFRERGINAGQTFSYLCQFVIGTLDEVKATILKLHEKQENGDQRR